MSERLYWNTVTPLLRSVLTTMMESELLKAFRLVGGTSLSLQLGHRTSDDIDLFTDARYGSVDFGKIDAFLRGHFTYVSEPSTGIIGMGESYLVGNSTTETVKLDLYYTDEFIEPELLIGPYRLATIKEIIAMKIEIVQQGARKKDFWDLHELLGQYSPEEMISLHKMRYPHTHDEEAIRVNFTNFTHADDDFDPRCIRSKYWELIKLDFVQWQASSPKGR